MCLICQTDRRLHDDLPHPFCAHRYYAYGFGSTANSNTEHAQQAYLFFQVLTLSLSVACASVCHILLSYLYFRQSSAYADAFADAVVGNVRVVFRLLLCSHVTYCCSLVLIGFVYFPNDSYGLGLTVAVFSVLLACVLRAFVLPFFASFLKPLFPFSPPF